MAESDKDIVGFHAKMAGLPRAERPRRVGAVITKPGRLADVDAYYKSLLDCLVACCLLIDDSPAWCELAPWKIERGPRQTVVTLEDI
jgi:hypothetical protein